MKYLPPDGMPLPKSMGFTNNAVSESHDESGTLPPWAEARGWRFLSWVIWPPAERDPWVLYDPCGEKVAEWLWPPTQDEILEVLRRQDGP